MNEPQKQLSVSPGSGLRPHSSEARSVVFDDHSRGVTRIDSYGCQVEQGAIALLAFA